jgi:1-aminocyclopropane-1-carboxylate deaminase
MLFVEFELTECLGMELRLPSPVEELTDGRLAAFGVRVFLKRDDLIHPDVPGNKWRKLKYNLSAARDGGFRTLLTFGGAYSNHLRATAAAGHHFGFATIGVVRGEPHLPLNPSLAYTTGHGMRLTYLDRAAYRLKTSQDVLGALRSEFGEFYLLPEGGTNRLAVLGCSEIAAEIPVDFDVICCPSGTGGTLAGIAAGLMPGQRAIGFSALKGAQFLDDEVRRLQHEAFGGPAGDWRIDHDHHFGGFAKRPQPLRAFAADFEERHGVELEQVYVAKMMYGLYALVCRGAFEPGTRVVALVTGPPGVE